MRTQRLFLGLPEHAGLHVLSFFFLATIILSCSEDKVQMISVDDVVWNFDFSKDGQHLFLISAWYRSPPGADNNWYPTNNKIGSFRAPGWDLEYEVEKPDGEVLHVLSCANPNVFMSSESMQCVDEACGCCDTLVVRDARFDIILSQTEVPFYWGTAQTAESNTYYYRCDQRENELYLWAKHDTISALDGDTGQFVRDYIAQDVGEFWSFELQEESDRLLLFDSSNNRIWVFRLSTGERLGVVETWQGHPPYEWVSLIDCVIADADHVVCTAIEQLGANDYLTQLVLVDLTGPSIERTYPLGKYIIYEQPPTPMPGGKVITVGRNLNAGPYHEFHEVLVTDLATGETTVPYRNYDYGWMKAFPELSVVRITGGEGVGTPNTWWVYSFPDFQLIKSGPQPIPTGDGVYLPKRKLFLSMAFGQMTVFDMQEYKFLDKLKMCSGADYWFRVDATERYAGVLCHGTENYKDVVAGIRPRGAGVAVVDLSRYFRE